MTGWHGVLAEGHLPCPQVRVAQEAAHKPARPADPGPVVVPQRRHEPGTASGKQQVGQDAFPAKNTGSRVRDRWAGWDKEPLTSASHSQVAVFEKLP